MLNTCGHQDKPIAGLPEGPAAFGYPEGQYAAISEHDGRGIVAQGGMAVCSASANTVLVNGALTYGSGSGATGDDSAADTSATSPVEPGTDTGGDLLSELTLSLFSGTDDHTAPLPFGSEEKHIAEDYLLIIVPA